MDGHRFDQLTKLVGTERSRREALKLFAAGIGAAVFGFRSLGGVEAGTCRAEGSPCAEGADCCSDLVCTFGACFGAGGCFEDGGECADSEECCGFLSCVESTCTKICQYETESCEVSDDCCSTLVCADDSTCQLCSLTGESCSSDSDCCDDRTCDGGSGTCVVVEAPTGSATITIHKATCPEGSGPNIFDACHGNGLGGVDFAIDGFEIGSGTVTTDASGVASHVVLEAAAEGDITITEDSGVLAGYLGAYVFCSEQNSGVVLYDGNAPDGAVTFHATQGDDIVCDWYNITKVVTPAPTATSGGVTTLPSTGQGDGESDTSLWLGAAIVGGGAALLAANKLRQNHNPTEG